MLNLTEKIGKLRTEQAKLSVKVLILIRDTLQPEQCAKVVELMKEERDKMRRRMEFMREKMQNRHGGSREDGFRERLPENEPPPVGEPGQEGNDGV
jgi:Spy/CpxP family protein refolding chaperone